VIALARANLFSSYKVGQTDNVSITHLQFVDDALIVGNKSWANISTFKGLAYAF